MTNEDAIEIVKTFRQAMDTPITEYREILLGALDMAIDALKEQRPQGEWVTDDATYSTWRCNKCLHVQTICSNYCPNCGADMRGEE